MEEKVGCTLSGNQLKTIALIAMTVDHMGKQLFPYMGWMQIVGRLAFPIFAFMIAEGCTYTKNRKKYFGGMALLALVCQAVYFVAERSLYQSVLVSFSMAILLIYAIDYARENPNMKGIWVAVLALGLICFACIGLPVLLSSTDYSIDYGIAGI